MVGLDWTGLSIFSVKTNIMRIYSIENELTTIHSILNEIILESNIDEKEENIAVAEIKIKFLQTQITGLHQP